MPDLEAVPDSRRPPFAERHYLLEQDLATACIGPFDSADSALLHPTAAHSVFHVIPGWVYDLLDLQRIDVRRTPEADLAAYIGGDSPSAPASPSAS